MNYEYKVIPAPTKGLKAKGVKSGGDRFANALQTAMNKMANDGWEYLRAETLPSEEREGLMGKTTVFQNVLVFGRAVTEATADEAVDEYAAEEDEQTISNDDAEHSTDDDVESLDEMAASESDEVEQELQDAKQPS